MTENERSIKNIVQQAMLDGSRIWVVTRIASAEEQPVSWRNTNVFVNASGELIDIRDVLVIRFLGEKQ